MGFKEFKDLLLQSTILQTLEFMKKMNAFKVFSNFNDFGVFFRSEAAKAIFGFLLRRVFSRRWPLAVEASLLVIRASDTRHIGGILRKWPARPKP